MFKFCLIFALLSLVLGHPQCLDYLPPFSPSEELNLCYEYQTFSCCNNEDLIEARYHQIINNLSPEQRNNCSSYIRAILCQECSPYAAHLYFAETDPMATDFPSLCVDYFSTFLTQCGSLLPNLTASFPIRQSDPNYCYPDVLSDPTQTRNLGQIGVRDNCIQLCVKEVINDIYSPTSAKPANDGTGRMFVVEQRGVVWIYLSNFTKLSPPFIDIRENVEESGRPFDERGLLDITFHPNFASNGRFFLHYTCLRGGKLKTRISEFRVADFDMNRARVSSEKIILEIDQVAANHNGGPLLFLDGFLYIFTGDGGRANDPHNNGQNLSSLLGKALRIDIDHGNATHPYAIPSDNPFVNMAGIRPEIYAYGLRNPWKCAIDRGDPETGERHDGIFCGDVGQGNVEEVDIVTSGGNYGWNGYEGNNCFRQCSRIIHHTRPIATYNHDIGESITGGFVYRGCESPNLRGKYIFGDWDNGQLFYLQENNGRWTRHNICMGGRSLCVNGGLSSDYASYINSFAEDEFGEVYILSTTYARSTFQGGRMYKLVDPSRRGNPSDCQQREHREVVIHPTAELHAYQSTMGVQVRLANRSGRPYYGRIEIRQPDGQWGGICHSNWYRRAANVICKQLGFKSAFSWRYRPNYGTGTGRIWLDNVRCNGQESSIVECNHRGWGVIQCQHRRQANVFCI